MRTLLLVVTILSLSLVFADSESDNRKSRFDHAEIIYAPGKYNSINKVSILFH